MKFAIITHAAHKIKGEAVFAYEPYVREMNLWIKYVDEVQIVAPISEDEVTSIESRYEFYKHYSEQGEAISSNEKIATSHTPRNDEMERYSEQGEAISSKEQITSSQASRNDKKPIKLIKIQAFNVTTLKNGFKAILKIPKIFIQIYKAMNWADHIHLRCPGNIGLLGCFVQILFSSKPKTIKYAGNWDPKSEQPLSYRLQKWILSNLFLTRNAKVLVYGEWPNQTKNIVPFFTASYSEKEIRHSQLDWESHDLDPKIKSLRQACTELSRSAQTDKNNEISNQVQHDEDERPSEQGETISSNEQIASSLTPRNDEMGRHPELVSGSHPNALNFIYVGGLTSGKQPLLSVQVIHELKKRGYNVQLDMYGEGSERIAIENYIKDYKLQNEIILHGNCSKEIIKKAYQQAHFLLFISKSEGWPKVVAEAMFWGCLPISSGVSCIPYMLGNGTRGAVVESNVKEIVLVIENYLVNENKYKKQTKKAMEWSRQYTLERFEEEIGMLL
jgi:glycosyltransferase involved in cell wall biosynthesis